MTFDNREELTGKILWEGGMEEALDYGINLEDLPADDKELRDAWEPMEQAWKAYQKLAEKVLDLLPDQEGEMG